MISKAISKLSQLKVWERRPSKAAVISLSGVCLSLLAYTWYLGGFFKPKVKTGRFPGIKHFFYKPIQGNLALVGKEIKLLQARLEKLL